jgi:phenylpyruvate tautomerase
MPLIQIFTSQTQIGEQRADELLRTLSSTLARELQKPEAYVMTCLVPESRMTFAASTAPSCYAVVKNIGEFTEQGTTRLSAVLCRTLSEGLGVPQGRIYLEFQNAEPHLWGFDGETFA